MVCVRIRKVKTMTNLEKVIKENGKEVVDKAFTEYMLKLIGDSLVLERIRAIVETGGTLEQIKEIVGSDDLDGCDTGVYSGDTFGKG